MGQRGSKLFLRNCLTKLYLLSVKLLEANYFIYLGNWQKYLQKFTWCTYVSLYSMGHILSTILYLNPTKHLRILVQEPLWYLICTNCLQWYRKCINVHYLCLNCTVAFSEQHLLQSIKKAPYLLPD